VENRKLQRHWIGGGNIMGPWGMDAGENVKEKKERERSKKILMGSARATRWKKQRGSGRLM